MTNARIASALGLSALMASSPALGGPCGKPVDLTQPGRSLHDYPTTVQDGNSCGAFTGALQADAWRLSHPPQPAGFTPGYVTSGSKLFMELLKAGLAKDEGSYPDASLKYLREHPVCDQRALFGTDSRIDAHSVLWNLQKIYDASVRDASERQSEMRAIYEGVLARHPNWMPVMIGLQGAYEFDLAHGYAELLCKEIADFGAHIPESPYGSLKLLAALLARATPEEFLDAYLKRACAASAAQSRIPEAVRLDTTDDWEIRRDINRAFDRENPQPVSITYCASLLMKKRPYSGRIKLEAGGYGCKEDDTYGIGISGPQQHVSALLGRRENPKTHECEFLLRNTWGQQCAAYKDLNSPWDCQGVSDLWISETELSHNVYQLTLFKTEL